MSDVVGVLACPLGSDYGVGSVRRATPRRGYRRALLTKSNPRAEEYMQSLFLERYPEGRLSRELPASADQIVLLYPDAIGLGWGRLERQLPAGVPVSVLNGRRREFPFDRRIGRALKLRRALERSMAVELAALLAAAVATPVLLVSDLARGRR